jgi:phage-related minor tail protein
MAEEVGEYTLPVFLSFEGVDKQVNSKLGKLFEGVGAKAGKDLGSGMKTAARDVDALAASYSKLKDKAADALGKLKGDEATLQRLRDTGASSDRIVKAEEKVAASRRLSARAAREADDAQKKLGDGSDNVGRKMSGMADLAGVASKALAIGVVAAAGAAVVGIGALAVGVAAAGRALYDLGAEFDDVFDNIRIKTGATGPALDALEQATERLATKVPLSIGEIGNVVAETSRALHLTGTDLDNTARSIANLGRLTGEPVNIRLLGKAFRGFGVDAKDQVPALDSMLQATQATGVGVNELLATVVKGGAGLRQLGFDFGESAALATQFEDAGLDADKAMTGLTKGLAGLAKDGKTGQDALRGTVDQIKDLLRTGNDAGALDLTNKLFGAKGGVQFFEAIKNGSLDLDALTDSLSGTGDTIAGLAADTDDWAERWQVFKNEIAVGLEPIGTAVFDGINGKLTELSDWVSGHKAEVIQFFGDLASTVTQKVAEALHGISLFISQGLVPMLRSVQEFGENNFLANFIPGAEELGHAAGILADGLGKIPGPLDDAARGVAGFVPQIDALTERTVDAQRFTTALGDATGAVSALDGKTIEISSNTPEVQSGLEALGIKIVNLPDGKFGVIPGTPEAERILNNFRDQQNKVPIQPPVRPDLRQANADFESFFARWNAQFTLQPPPVRPGPTGPPLSTPTSNNPFALPPRAQGGIFDVWDSVASFANGKLPSQAMIQPPVAGAGLVQWAEPSTGGEAFIPLNGGARSLKIWAETGRRLTAFDQGGMRGPDVDAAEELLGTTYSQADRTDCSGMVARVISRAMGLPEAGLMTTKNAAQWLAAHGFQAGRGGPGQISVGWYDHGPGSNDGHMAMTLSDGTNAEAGGKNGVFTIGPAASGADSPQFDQHMFLPTLFGEGSAGFSSAGGSGGGGAGGGGTPGVGPNGEAGTYSAPDAKSVREANQKIADADQRVKEAEAKQRELEADAKESQKISAQADVDKAKREAADARADRDEVMKGKFTPGGSGGKGSGPQMSELGSIAKSFVTETFGLDGSWLPDIGNLAPLKMVDTLLGAFAGGGGGGPQTSSSPFGIPDIMAPPMPPDGMHTGSGGLPGPAGNVTYDLSNNYQGNVGLSPEEIRKQNERAQARGVARIGGIPMAQGN